MQSLSAILPVLQTMATNIVQTDAVPSSVLHSTLSTQPPKIVGSHGNYLVTSDGREIFDASGGPAVACIGHNHPRVKQAIKAQLDTISYCYSPWFTTEAYEKLAKLLTDSTHGQMERVFVTGSGAEAIEAAMKMARQYFMELPEPQPRRVRFIARDRSYHGNTLGSLAVSGHKARRAIYEPLLSTHMSHVLPCYPYRDLRPEETDAQYVARLAQNLEDEFQRVGPDTVIGFVAETVSGLVWNYKPFDTFDLLRRLLTGCCRPLAVSLLCQDISKP
jgi:adenosylmethionine-8-amino-7-oxononanoate aminotransferase